MSMLPYGKKHLAMLVLALMAAWALTPGSAVAAPQTLGPQGSAAVSRLGEPLLPDPIFVYNNWSSYDELSDNVLLTEALAMRELDQILRLRRLGVRFDYYMMDAFWFAQDGGYRTWRKSSWPNGPWEWIKKCRDNGIQPGLWFGTNMMVKIDAAPEWKNSLNQKGWQTSFTEGGFLPHFMDTLQFWYDRGIRMFKFDFADFDVATPATEKILSKDEIRTRNVTAFREALRRFRQKNPDVVLVAFNGFGGDTDMTAAPFPFKQAVDVRWLEVFDSMYSGDPRPSDVPQMNFWRSMDIYSDHMVRRYEQSYLPLERIDSTGCMFGNTGTIYYRKTHAWKGMLALMMARGGWVNTVHGNLEFLTDEDAKWFAKVQSMYLGLQARGRTKTFGGIPGEEQPYGFGSIDANGAVYAVVNPSESVQELQLPLLTHQQAPIENGRILLRDAGFEPVLNGDRIRLGPGEMALVGVGAYADARYDLGVQNDVVIPRAIQPLPCAFKPGDKTIEGTLAAPHSDLRIVVQQRDAKGNVHRTWAGGPPKGTSMAKVLTIRVEQNGHVVPLEINYDKVIWSGLSWAVGEVKAHDLAPGAPIKIQCASTEKDPVTLDGHVYEVQY